MLVTIISVTFIIMVVGIISLYFLRISTLNGFILLGLMVLFGVLCAVGLYLETDRSHSGYSKVSGTTSEISHTSCVKEPTFRDVSMKINSSTRPDGDIIGGD